MLRKFIYWLQSRCTRCGNSVDYAAVESMEGVVGWNRHCPFCGVTTFVHARKPIAQTQDMGK